MIKLYLLGQPLFLFYDPFSLAAFACSIWSAHYYLSTLKLGVGAAFFTMAVFFSAIIIPASEFEFSYGAIIYSQAHMAMLGLVLTSTVHFLWSVRSHFIDSQANTI